MIGRKPIIKAGLLLAVLTYFPLFSALIEAAIPELARAQATSQIVVKAHLRTCSFLGSPVAREVDFNSGCDIAKRALTGSSASSSNEPLPPGTAAVVKIDDKEIIPPIATLLAGS